MLWREGDVEKNVEDVLFNNFYRCRDVTVSHSFILDLDSRLVRRWFKDREWVTILLSVPIIPKSPDTLLPPFASNVNTFAGMLQKMTKLSISDGNYDLDDWLYGVVSELYASSLLHQQS